MKQKILYIERNFWKNAGIEKVFRQIARDVSGKKFEIEFQTVKYRNNLQGMLKNLLFFRKKTKADIYHITGQIHYIALFLPGEKTVLTIHDLIFLHIRKGLRRYILKKILLDLPVRKLRYITAISQATKDEIIKYTGCPQEKIRVIENPLFDNFRTVHKKVFNKDCPVILHIGTAENKNIERLAGALQGISCRLRIIGRVNSSQMARIRHCGITFENVFGLDEKHMIEEYKNADIVTFCSTYEGFGLPIIEAQALGTPVITSDLSPLREVAGQAAHLADPFDTESIRHGIKKLIEDEDYRESLITKGLENISRFDPKEIARQYEELYEEISQNN